MPYFMSQWSYVAAEVRALIDKPQNRADVVAKAIEAFGGKLHQFYFTFGEFDGVAISEFPDKGTALACFMTFAGEGGLKSFRTTALLTPEESNHSMEIARKVFSNYKPPSG